MEWWNDGDDYEDDDDDDTKESMGWPYDSFNCLLWLCITLIAALTVVKNYDWPMMSRPTDFLNDFFVCYQDLSVYVGLANIEQGFHGEPALKKHY